MIDEKKIIVALDTDNLNRALNLVKKLKKEALSKYGSSDSGASLGDILGSILKKKE